MAPMTEIRIQGRGGQGNVTAAYMLAQAAFEAGRFAQAFPSFGPERRGAPVAAFVRIDDRPIRRRCQIRDPKYVIIQDAGLLHAAGVAQRVPADGGILINSAKPVDELGLAAANGSVTAIAATQLAVEILGEPIPNTALLAAFMTVSGILPLAALERVLCKRFEGAALERNLRLMREAAARVASGSWKDSSRAPGN